MPPGSFAEISIQIEKEIRIYFTQDVMLASVTVMTECFKVVRAQRHHWIIDVFLSEPYLVMHMLCWNDPTSCETSFAVWML